MHRRSLLKLGLAATALLALGGGSVALVRPGFQQGRLTPYGRSVFNGIANAVLDASLPVSALERTEALASLLRRLDTTIAALAPTTQDDLSQLLALIYLAPGRRALFGLQSPWQTADVAEIQQALQSLRVSSLQVRQQVYHALRDLTNAAYYSNPLAWHLLGYPGPTPA